MTHRPPDRPITMLYMTDGRDDLLHHTFLRAYLSIRPSHVVIHDDTGDSRHRAHLRHHYCDIGVDVIGGDERRGFGGAIAAAWAHLDETSANPYIVHMEDDFVLTRDVDWSAMMHVLHTHPDLVNLVLRRQPWNDDERAAGGIVEQHPDWYTEVRDGRNAWLEHRAFFSTNPGIYRTSLIAEGWPTGRASEGMFGIELKKRYPNARFGYWGARDSGEWCEHIGVERVGTGY